MKDTSVGAEVTSPPPVTTKVPAEFELSVLPALS